MAKHEAPKHLVPVPDSNDEDVKLAEAGARWAVKRAHLARYKKRRADLAREMERLEMEILEVEQEVADAEAAVERYAAMEDRS